MDWLRTDWRVRLGRLRRPSRIILIIVVAYAAGILLTPVAQWAAAALAVQPKAGSGDTIVLLSSGAFRSGELPGSGWRRVIQSMLLYREGRAPRIIVCGGSISLTGAPYGQVYADWLQRLGIPADDIIIDTGSRGTYENVEQAALIMQEHGWKTGLLVTDPLHMRRALQQTADSGVVFIPAGWPDDYNNHGGLDDRWGLHKQIWYELLANGSHALLGSSYWQRGRAAYIRHIWPWLN